MTNALFEKTGSRYHIAVNGHSLYRSRETEADVVCSACSMLIGTLIESLHRIQSYKGISDFDVGLCSGNVDIGFTVHDDARLVVKSTINTVITGFELLQEEYPGYVSLNDRAGEK